MKNVGDRWVATGRLLPWRSIGLITKVSFYSGSGGEEAATKHLCVARYYSTGVLTFFVLAVLVTES